jgi:glutathione S-transferase
MTTTITTVTKPTLTYFDSVGRAEVLRLILEEAGVDYDYIAMPGFAGWLERREEYLSSGKVHPPSLPLSLSRLVLVLSDTPHAIAHSGKLAFGQLPLYEEPGFVLVQSVAIARYLAMKHGLQGTNDTEAALIDQANEGVQDVWNRLTQVLVFTPESEQPEAKAKLIKDYLPAQLAYFSRLLEKNGNSGYLVGGHLSYADLGLWVTLTTAAKRLEGATELIERHLNLKAFIEGVSARDRIKAYLARDVYNKAKKQ